MNIIRGVALAIGLIGCSGSDGADDGNDTLPKRGERTTDPTIVSATAACSGELMYKGLLIRVDGTDAMGLENLSTCAATAESATSQGIFTSRGTCFMELTPTCAVGAAYQASLTIASKTGGVTTAAIVLPPAGP
jgi:hypothetical protein